MLDLVKVIIKFKFMFNWKSLLNDVLIERIGVVKGNDWLFICILIFIKVFEY